MNPLIVIGALTVVPAVLILVFRINAALVFLALCAGSVVNEFLGSDFLQFFNSFFPTSSTGVHSAATIGFLVLPAVLTMIFMRKSVGASKFLLNLIPALLSGVLLTLLVVPLLADGTAYTIMSSDAWNTLQQFQGVTVGAAALASFLILWSSNKGGHGGKKRLGKK